ncbi:acetylglutamate kinase [Aureibacter tunicatorum]|uniref:Acetylglutamate kinase n=1 Tax=Aureibacter tunicatorum TaxID=866807 RepID=A0AAE3XNJ9_9BACT|nr:acetylglutamate kinase [Aureibacter tunicatorum]MDR6239752.1 acetylglutamate kinase [Aureibacter tunicatorum]BDD04228.1 acetylglutamate kinase [Aureibacter tunicatorum]
MEQLKIIKIGGNIIDDENALESFLNDFSKIHGKKILIHGGGKIATKVSQALGIQTQMHEGRRITCKDTIDVVTMTYAGLINKKIVAELQKYDCNAIGLTGADGNLIPSIKRPVKDIDYGFVGDVKEDKINTSLLQLFISKEICPVFCAITHDENGQLLNTNADTIAATIAKSLSKVYNVDLIYCFEKNGVLADINDNNSVIKNITPENFDKLKSEGIIANGMIPKLSNAFDALDYGVNRVIIKNAQYISDDSGTFITQN